MQHSSRLLGLAGRQKGEAGHVEVDVGAVLRRLLLFDAFIVSSTRLAEIPELARVIGVEGLTKVLNTGALKFYPYPLAVASAGTLPFLEKRVQKGPLPLGSFSFTAMVLAVDDAGRKSYVSDCLRASVDAIPCSFKEGKRLRRAIGASLESLPDSATSDIISQLNTDLLSQNPSIRLATVRELKRQFGIVTSAENVALRFEQIDIDEFASEHNLTSTFGLDAAQSHAVIERAALSVGGANQRLLEMRELRCFSGLSPEDRELFEQKLWFLLRESDPESQEGRFLRTMEIANLPDFNQVGHGYVVDIDRFLDLRESPECREFRAWLPTVDAVSDKEIEERVGSLRARIGGVLGSAGGKALRFIGSAGVGAIPIVGPVAGAAVGVLDTFVIDRLFRTPGVVAFLGHSYPKLFEMKF